MPCSSKLLERIIYNRLYEFVLKNEILYKKQFRFWAAHSRDHAILEFVISISNSFENGWVDTLSLYTFLKLLTR